MNMKDDFARNLAHAKRHMRDRLGGEKYIAEMRESARWETAVFDVQRGDRGFSEEERARAEAEAAGLVASYADQHDVSNSDRPQSELTDPELAEQIVSGWWAGYYEHY